MTKQACGQDVGRYVRADQKTKTRYCSRQDQIGMEDGKRVWRMFRFAGKQGGSGRM